MQYVAIFNPEHDLCLANGDPNFVPPASALEFGTDCRDVMQMLYAGDETTPVMRCVGGGELYDSRFRWEPDWIPLPWGWNRTVRRLLLRRGCRPETMPAEAQLDVWRRLSDRRTAMEAARRVCEALDVPCEVATAASVADVASQVEEGERVLKAPLSGSGRGLRMVRHPLTPHDRAWVQATVAQQGVVMVERRHRVVQDFALEFVVRRGMVHFVGCSLFETSGGVYAGNRLLSDEDIVQLLGRAMPRLRFDDVRRTVASWLTAHVATLYEGPLGVDMFLYDDGAGVQLNPLVEINLRHTMGMVAHRLAATRAEWYGRRFAVRFDAGGRPRYRLSIE